MSKKIYYFEQLYHQNVRRGVLVGENNALTNRLEGTILFLHSSDFATPNPKGSACTIESPFFFEVNWNNVDEVFVLIDSLYVQSATYNKENLQKNLTEILGPKKKAS